MECAGTERRSWRCWPCRQPCLSGAKLSLGLLRGRILLDGRTDVSQQFRPRAVRTADPLCPGWLVDTCSTAIAASVNINVYFAIVFRTGLDYWDDDCGKCIEPAHD